MMKRTMPDGRLPILAVFLCGAVCAQAAAQSALTLIADGRSAYTIVVPDQESGGRTTQAAEFLQKCLKEASDVELPIAAETAHAEGRPAIYLGATRAACRAGLPVDALVNWDHIKAVKGRDLFLAGRDCSAATLDRPKAEYLGTMKAVLSFLQDEAGVRFLMPGPNGIHVPRLDTLAVDAGLHVERRPRFLFYSYSRPQEPIYDIANNYFPGTHYRSWSGHSYYRAVPKEKYAKTHPEYFALIGGVRTSTQGHLCISNPEVQDLMIQHMETYLDGGYEWVQIGQTDGYKQCECANCSAMGDGGERLLRFHRKLAEIMKQRRPGKRVVILAPYGPVQEPPATFKKFPDNVILEMCRYTPETFDAWRHVTDQRAVYVYNWGSYRPLGFLPKTTPRFAADQIRLFAKNDVLGMYKCGFGECLGLEGPVYYVYGQMMGDPSLDYRVLEDDYYRAAFGKAYAPMKTLFTQMYKRLELYVSEGRGKMASSPEDVISYFFPPTLLLSMEKNVKLAQALDESPRVAARIRLVGKELEYVKSVASVFHLCHAYQLHPSWTTFDLLAEAVEARNRLIDSFYEKEGRNKGKMITFDGWPRFLGNAGRDEVMAGGKLGAHLAAPFNWDFALLREKKILPGTGGKTVRVPRADGITLDGRLSEPTWAQTKPEEFVEMNMGALREPTQFRMCYDDGHVYLGFVCENSAIEKMEVEPLGEDGRAWIQECIEIFIDPLGNRDRYCHLIFNPVPNSRYDGRKGFVTDPLHPLYNKNDPEWDGDWEYAAHVDAANKRWTAEVRIPFATLETEPARSGAKWCLNVGREHYAGKTHRGKKDQELSLWSPNLESRSFGAPHAFGDVVFE
ncbi:MAG: DUF4838 domain-containing protein [Kiritimatiellae bacterium]|nr:DUF4838 domain-containing protein [Kiritimatiellia bacterium]